MALVKCRFCGKKINRDEAYLVKVGKANKYYCSYEHSISKSDKDMFYEALWDVFGKQLTSTAVYTEFDAIAKVHGYSKMLSFTKDNLEKLQMYNSRSNGSSYGRIRYMATIYKNQLDDYEPKEQTVRKEVEILPDMKFKPKKKRIGLEEILGGVKDG